MVHINMPCLKLGTCSVICVWMCLNLGISSILKQNMQIYKHLLINVWMKCCLNLCRVLNIYKICTYLFALCQRFCTRDQKLCKREWDSTKNNVFKGKKFSTTARLLVQIASISCTICVKHTMGIQLTPTEKTRTSTSC